MSLYLPDDQCMTLIPSVIFSRRGENVHLEKSCLWQTLPLASKTSACTPYPVTTESNAIRYYQSYYHSSLSLCRSDLRLLPCEPCLRMRADRRFESIPSSLSLSLLHEPLRFSSAPLCASSSRYPSLSCAPPCGPPIR